MTEYHPYIWMSEDDADSHMKDWRDEELLRSAQGGRLPPRMERATSLQQMAGQNLAKAQSNLSQIQGMRNSYKRDAETSRGYLDLVEKALTFKF